LRVYKLIGRYHKQIIIASDIMLKFPEIIPGLPKDLIVDVWEFSSQPNYNRWFEPFAKAGLRMMADAWTSNTGLITPDNAQAAANIGTLISDGKKFGIMGAYTSPYNDDHETLFDQNWWGLTYAAAESWEAGKTSVEDFDRKYDWAFYRNTGHQFAEAIEKLSSINQLMGGKERSRGTDNALFWQNPFAAEGRANAQRMLPLCSKIRLAAESSYAVFANDAMCARRNRDTLEEMKFAALKIDALAMRYQYVQEISERYTNAIAFEHKDKAVVGSELYEIDGAEGRLDDLIEYTTHLKALYAQLWRQQNLPAWLPNVLYLYDRNIQMWQDLKERYAQIEREYYEGKPFPPASSLGLLPVMPKN